MLFKYCTNRETSNKKEFPTFARTRPPDTQISKSVVAVLKVFNWTKVKQKKLTNYIAFLLIF
jgi:hypothetical protein